jgi:hypothetical protein
MRDRTPTVDQALAAFERIVAEKHYYDSGDEYRADLACVRASLAREGVEARPTTVTDSLARYDAETHHFDAAPEPVEREPVKVSIQREASRMGGHDYTVHVYIPDLACNLRAGRYMPEGAEKVAAGLRMYFALPEPPEPSDD